MLAVVQRVSLAWCIVEGKTVANIDKGVLVLLAISKDDGLQDARWMVKKIVNLRIFEDQTCKMNLSLLQIGGEILVVPQFTLYGNCRKGCRPNFSQAANPQIARDLFSRVLDFLNEYPLRVTQGLFGARMRVELKNEGPVTLILNSNKQVRC